jgi:O-acetyl-ADP-ribose deacetylase (regulator of RNase III)
VHYKFETTNCPNCGAQLARECARCDREIFAPVVDRCQFCGLPQPWAAERREGAERASIRLWRQKRDKKSKSERRAHDPALRLYRLKGRGDVWVIDGDIAHLAVDAVVSNNDIDGQMWAQVASAIKNAAGEGVERFAQDGKPFRLGQAWVTAPGALQHMKGIIHVASMTRNGESTIETVRKCLTAALKVATKEGYESVGIGAIGSGPRGAIDPSTWFETFAEITTEYLSSKTKKIKTRPPISIVLVLFEPSDFEKDLATLHRAFWDAWVKLKKPSKGKPAVCFETPEQRLSESDSR